MNPASKNEDDLIALFERNLDISSDFPFLNDDATIKFVKNSKVMIINRGLPGSGKSTLSKKIYHLYGAENGSIICSGDDFFVTETGEYKFDASKLADAHTHAQNKASDACRNSISPVIIDNTNIKYWEVNKYLSIARSHNYIVILIEPKTAHKFDVEKLAKLNQHNVPKETIRKKLSEYQIIYPYYFGWFIDTNESNSIVTLAKEYLKECSNVCVDFKNNIKSRTTKEPNEIFDYSIASILHCTAKFLGRNFNNHQDPYLKSSKVSENMGKMHRLEITGFSISHRTIAAVVKLNPDMKSLWDNDLHYKSVEKIIDEDEYFKMVRDKPRLIKELEIADRAHLTIGLAANTQAVQSGIDLLNIKLRIKLNKLLGKPINTVKANKCEIYFLGGCYCFLKLNDSIFVDSIFAGEY